MRSYDVAALASVIAWLGVLLIPHWANASTAAMATLVATMSCWAYAHERAALPPREEKHDE